MVNNLSYRARSTYRLGMHLLTPGRFLPIALLVSAYLLLLTPLSVARAGDCPTCTASTECSSSSDPGFCVVHDAPVGCGALVTLCCPGQGCGIGVDGRPSCEAAGTCTVIEDIVADAGMSDAGMSDAGTSDTDAGTSDTGIAGSDAGGSDTGVVGTDAGSSGTDSGVRMDAGVTPPVEGGCSCRVPGSSDPSSALAWVSIAIGLMLSRRRVAKNR